MPITNIMVDAMINNRYIPMSSSLPSLLLPNIHENNQNFSQEKLHYSLSSKVVEFDLPPIKRQKVDGRLMAESVISQVCHLIIIVHDR